MYTVKFDFPNLPKDGEIDITGLTGIFKNGHTYKISAAEAEAYRVAHQHPVVSADTGVTEWELGRTLLEAYKDVEGVTVQVAKQEGGSN